MCDQTLSDNTAIDVERAFSCYQVQRTITSYLDVTDLKNLRLVSKLWRHSAIISLKEKSQLKLDSPSSISKYIDFLHEINYSTCFSNYKIIFKPDKFNGVAEAATLFGRFWEICSDSVKELSLVLPWTSTYAMLKCIFYNKLSSSSSNQSSYIDIERLSLTIEDVERGRVEWLTGTENVEEPDTTKEPSPEEETCLGTPVFLPSLGLLHLNVSIVLNAEKKVFPFGWGEFFQVCSNLCHLSIQSDYASGHFYKIVNVLLERNMWLKTLKIGTRDQRLFSDDYLRKLSLLTTSQTETVSFGFLPTVRHDSPLDAILLKSSRSLRHLTFLQIRTSNQATIICFTATDACEFPHLHTLRITKELVPNLNFLRKMPKLKRLEIYRDSTIGQHDTLSNPVMRTRELPIMGNLQRLVLEPFVPVEEVWKLVRWFPNLKTLQMKATDVIARVIFMSWKELKELYLVGEIVRDNNDIVRSTLTDEGITGIPKELLQQQCLENVDEDGNRDSIISASRAIAYIGDLKNLEVCKLQAIPDYQTGLTDYSVHYGLKDLPSLTCLTLVKTLVSPAAAEELRSRNVHVTLSIN